MLQINFTSWTDNTQSKDAPEFSSLHGEATIYGQSSHCECIAVETNDIGEQAAIDRAFQFDLDQLYTINREAPFCTVQIPGFSAEYVIVIYPHASC